MPSSVSRLYVAPADPSDHESAQLEVGWASDLLVVRRVGCPRCEAVFGSWDVVQPARMSDAQLVAFQRALETWPMGMLLVTGDAGVSRAIRLGPVPLRTIAAWRAALAP